MNIRDPRKAFRATTMLAYSRGFLRSRIYPILWRGCHHRDRGSGNLHFFQFSGIQVVLSDHVHRRAGVHNKLSFLRLHFGWWRETPLFRSREEISFSFWLWISGFSLPASTLLREHNALSIPSLPETDPQILERSGFADEVRLRKFHWARDFGLYCWHGAVRLCWIVHFELVPAWLSSSVKSMKTSAAPCLEIYNPHCCRCTLVASLIRPGAGPWFNPAVCEGALVPECASLFGLVQQALWGMPLFTRWIRTSTFKMYLARLTRCFPRRTSSSRTPESHRIFHTLCLRRRFWERSRLCRTFARLFRSCQKLQWSPFKHCPEACHCQQSPCPFWTRRCSLWFLTKTLD